MPTKLQKARKNTENFGRAELKGEARDQRRERVMTMMANRAPTNDEVKAAVSARQPGLSGPSDGRRRWWPPTMARRGC